MDGTLITGGALNLLPSSRGSLTLSSTDPAADPVIDPNYNATEADKVIIRDAMRTAMRAVETPAGKSIIAKEHIPLGFPPLTSASTDDELDARIRRFAGTWFHPAGTASMGTVVDTDCKVKGVDGLQVVDGSILPVPIAAHYQAAMYATAEAAADVILGHNAAK